MSTAEVVARTIRPIKLRTINHLLTGVTVILALYIITMPFLPDITWWIRHHTPFHGQQAASLPLPKADKKEDRPQQNTLVVPRLDMKQTIFEGSTATTLRQGLWHRPATSNPAAGGNTVIVGHRFTYHDPAIFYHLDKVEVGDPIIAYWQGERYDYKVAEKKVVPPTAIDIEKNTSSPELTLYTCTPVWTARDRLVIVAKLTGHEK